MVTTLEFQGELLLWILFSLLPFVASFVDKKHDRKVTMFFGGLFFLLGALLNAVVVHISMLIFSRILRGVGVGCANQSVPIYLSEIAPYKYMCIQCSLTIGHHSWDLD